MALRNEEPLIWMFYNIIIKNVTKLNQEIDSFGFKQEILEIVKK